MKRLICFAHRGASGHEPENTLAAFEKAILLGSDWIELDVYAVAGELLVIHGERLEDTTNGSGHVMGKSLTYLRSLDAGKGQQIPTLREVFDLVDRRIGINVELKGPHTAAPVVSLINEHVKHRGWQYEQFIVSSFNHPELIKAKDLQSAIKTGVLINGVPLRQARFAQGMGAYSMHVSLPCVRTPFIKDAHRRRLKVFVFTVNEPEDLARLLKMGVDGVFTDYPERVVHCAL